MLPNSILSDVVTYETLDSADYGVSGNNIDAIKFDGVTADNEQKSVFAFIAYPDGYDPDGNTEYPAVVLVHGGAGNADAIWAKNWAKKGYVALSMDMYGNEIAYSDLSSNVFDKNANPTAVHTDPYSRTTSFKSSIKDSMMYNNVINVVHAHNLLRSIPNIDTSKIGISGISWGAVTTATVIGFDERFAFAVPIYGGGYLYESETEFKTMLGDNLRWDPSKFLADSNVPTLWLNSNSDPFFSVNTTSKSYEITKGKNDNSAIIIKSGTSVFGHSQQTARKTTEPMLFADSIINGSDKFINITNTSFANNEMTVTFTTDGTRTAVSAELMYNTDGTIPYGGGSAIVWQSATAQISGSTVTSAVPADAKRFYINITDASGTTVSSKLIEK